MLAVKVWPVLRSVWSRAAGVLFGDGSRCCSCTCRYGSASTGPSQRCTIDDFVCRSLTVLFSV